MNRKNCHSWKKCTFPFIKLNKLSVELKFTMWLDLTLFDTDEESIRWQKFHASTSKWERKNIMKIILSIIPNLRNISQIHSHLLLTRAKKRYVFAQDTDDLSLIGKMQFTIEPLFHFYEFFFMFHFRVFHIKSHFHSRSFVFWFLLNYENFDNNQKLDFC